MSRALTACFTSPQPQGLCPVPVGGKQVVPASVRGTIQPGSLTVNPSVQSDSVGIISISGSVQVQGSYISLDYDNQPSTVRDTFAVDFNAHAYATTPTSIVWDQQ